MKVIHDDVADRVTDSCVSERVKWRVMDRQTDR